MRPFHSVSGVADWKRASGSSDGISLVSRSRSPHTGTVEGGTLLGFAVAGAAGLLVAAGSALARGRRPASDLWRVIGITLLIALAAAVCGVFVVGAGTDAWLNATAPSCPYSGEGEGSCVALDNLGKQAAAVIALWAA